MTGRDNPAPNRPASGTYGEKADRKKLERSLPPMEPQAPPPPRGGAALRPANPPGLPPGQEGHPPGQTPPRGLPRALAGPGGQALPEMGPLLDPVVQAASMPADQRTIMILDTLASSPQVSGATREWARVILDILFDAGA